MLDQCCRRACEGLLRAVATVMTLEQPLDKRLLDSKNDDVEILGKLVTRGDDWEPIGFALHVQNGVAIASELLPLLRELRPLLGELGAVGTRRLATNERLR